MVNGGCVFYQYELLPYVYLLGLKGPDVHVNINEFDQGTLMCFIRWFSRFADLLARTSYRQQWYKDIMLGFKLESQEYIKSFFTILANLAFCIQKYDTEDSDKLTSAFKELLQFEIDRDYSDEIDTKAEIEKIIQEHL